MLVYVTLILLMTPFYAGTWKSFLFYFVTTLTLFYGIFTFNIYYDILASCYDWCGIQVIFFYPLFHAIIALISLIIYWINKRYI